VSSANDCAGAIAVDGRALDRSTGRQRQTLTTTRAEVGGCQGESLSGSQRPYDVAVPVREFSHDALVARALHPEIECAGDPGYSSRSIFAAMMKSLRDNL
jgi:hypothetical protein